MSKANAKDAAAFPQGRKNQDLLQRLNHLYQANTYLASLSSGNLRARTQTRDGARSTLEDKVIQTSDGHSGRTDLDALGVAVRKSNHRFGVMVKHNILATDPSLKRSFCKGCNTICIPGHNARVRVKSAASKIHGNRITTTCLTCQTTRTIPAPPITGRDDTPVTGPARSGAASSDSKPQPVDLAYVRDPPNKPTEMCPSEKLPLDGVNRLAKRQKLSRRAQFSRKEAVQAEMIKRPPITSTASPSIALDDVADANRTCDVEDPSAKVSDMPSSVIDLQPQIPPTDVPQKQKQQKGQKGQKQKGRNAGRGNQAKQEGHSLWRGDELVVGWGDPVSQAVPTRVLD
ncbi:hypothetical protein NliqN6_1755 [Naganishia liquefaciens]|uniref:Rpr2-domain-containing protein n=1 Tax=Naganishia liquefaciens TaxID=104408 RepID=A0A8H3TR42_9TREE|nr:hypothetical protein NliqN6_1755 [Naganishia liquefaciens]